VPNSRDLAKFGEINKQNLSKPKQTLYNENETKEKGRTY
jgi:hypothetical protein